MANIGNNRRRLTSPIISTQSLKTIRKYTNKIYTRTYVYGSVWVHFIKISTTSLVRQQCAEDSNIT